MNVSIPHVILILAFGVAAAARAAAASLETDGVLTLLEEIHVPARDAGVLTEVAVRPGTQVTPEMLLARLDDTAAQVSRDQAKTDLANARRLAANDLKVRLAQKAHEVAAAELKRATDAEERFSKSVSQTEIDRLRLAAEQADLQVGQARFDLETARLAIDAQAAALRLAEHQLKQRAIHASMPGVVVEVLKHAGEWVEPGETVVRIVRMDRLRVEGFLPAQAADARLVGQTATVRIKLRADQAVEVAGEVTFVSPEIHPVNGMIRMWVDIDNAGAQFRPGLPASIKVDP